MSDHGRIPATTTRNQDGDRRRFLRCVAAVTGSRQVSLNTITGGREESDEQGPRR
jgi:hypothetical protein